MHNYSYFSLFILGGSGMKQLLFLVVFMCLCVLGMATEKQHIQRINYGIIFEQTSNIYLGQENWIHTFQIQLPKKLHLSGELYCNMPQCKTAGHIIKSLNSLRTQLMASVNTTVRHIHQMIPSTEEQALNTYVGSSQSKRRHKRGLFDFVGQISKSLFGTATSADINTLKRHMQVLNNNNVKLAQAMALQDKHLSSFITTVDDRFNNVMNAVQKNHEDTVALTDLAHRSMDALEHEFLLLSQMILKQVNVSAQLEKELEHIKLGIHDLVKGKLSPFLMSPHNLKSCLHQIQAILDTKYSKFSIIHKDPLYYYSNGDFLYTRTHSHLYITLKIPISSFAQPILSFNIYSFPVPVNSTEGHATQLLNLPDYFLHTSDNQQFTTLSTAKISQCSGTTTLFCKFNVAFKASASPTCLSAIFFNQKDLVNTLCDFRFIENSLTPSIVELSPSHTLIYKTSMLALDCPNGQTIRKGCAFCIMTIPCRCSVTSDNLYLPPRLGECNNNTNDITILHPVNLALLQEFFNEDTHSTIFGDTIFDEFVNLQIPSFHIFNHSFSQYLANDNKQHLSLKRIAKAMKKDGTVFQTLAESMIAGKVDFALDQWPDTSGIIAIIATSLAFFGFIFSLWSCYKIRTLLLPGLLLHQAHHATASLTSKPTLSFIYDPASVNPTPKTIEEHIYTSFTTPWPYVTLSVLTTIVIFACLTNLWQKFLRTHKTTLHLEITSGPACELVNLVTLPLCPHNWNIQTPQDVSSINITRSYFFFHYLEIKCTPFNITNTHTNRSVSVSTTKLLSTLQARRIRNILRHPYTAYFLLSHHQYFQILT